MELGSPTDAPPVLSGVSRDHFCTGARQVSSGLPFADFEAYASLVKTPRDDADRLFWHGINARTHVLYLGGINEHDLGGDEDMAVEAGIYWNTARRLILGLSLLDNTSDRPITIIMNSCGGDWDHGMAIYDAIACCCAHVTIINMSHARSMSSIIFQAADLRITAPNGFYMIHDGFNAFGPDIPKSVANTVEFDKRASQTMYQIYLDRLQETDDADEPKVDIHAAADILNPKLPSGANKIKPRYGVQGIKLDHIAQLCGQDTFFTPVEMVQLNFADRLLERGDLAGAYANPKMHGLPTGQRSLEDEEE